MLQQTAGLIRPSQRRRLSTLHPRHGAPVTLHAGIATLILLVLLHRSLASILILRFFHGRFLLINRSARR